MNELILFIVKIDVEGFNVDLFSENWMGLEIFIVDYWNSRLNVTKSGHSRESKLLEYDGENANMDTYTDILMDVS